MENHEHHRSTDGQDKYPLTVCNLSFVSRKSVTAFVVIATTAILGIATTVFLQCNSDARENGVRDTKIYNVEKTQIEILNTVNKVSDATSTRQTEILKAIDDLKRINRTHP
jgi:hypothetical protein